MDRCAREEGEDSGRRERERALFNIGVNKSLANGWKNGWIVETEREVLLLSGGGGGLVQ